MTIEVQVAVLLIWVSAALTGSMAYYSFRHLTRPGALTLALLLTAMSGWSLLYAAELQAPSLVAKVIFAKLQYLAITTIPPLWLIFALQYTGHDDWLTPFRRWLLFVPGMVTCLLVFTNEWHSLIWHGVTLDPGGHPELLVVGYGVGFWFHTTIAYSLIIGGIALYIVFAMQVVRLYRYQALMMVGSALVPLLGNAVYLSGALPLGWVDPTPLIFAGSGLLLAIGFFRFGLFDITPITARTIVTHLQDAVMVLDHLYRVVEFNPAAQRLLRIDEQIIGYPLNKLVQIHQFIPDKEPAEGSYEIVIGTEANQRVFQLSVAMVRERQHVPVGYILVWRETTREHVLLATERRRVERQRHLVQSIGELLAATNTAAFYNTLMVAAQKVLAADKAAIYLYDRASDSLSCPYASGLSAEYVATINRFFHNVPGAKLFQNPRPIVVVDAQTHPDLAPLREAIVREGFHSYAIFPLFMPDGLGGAFAVYWNVVKPFSEDEINAGQTLAYVAAAMLENKRLLIGARRHARQMALLNEITRTALGIDDLHEMLRLLANRLGELFEADGAYLTLWDKHLQRPVPVAANGELHERYVKVRVEPGETTLTASVLLERRVLAIEDVFNTPYQSRRIAALFPARSILALPLMVDQQKLGAALIGFNQRHQFTDEEITLGEQVAAQLSLAIVKTHLLAAEREQRRLAEALRQAGLALSESLDVNTILDRLLDEIQRVVPYDSANVMIVEYDEQQQAQRARLTHLRGYDRFGEAVARAAAAVVFEVASTPNLQRMLTTGRPFIIPDTAQDPGWVDIEAAAHVRSWAGAPIIIHGRVIAFFSLDKTEPNFYRPEHADYLAAFTGHAVLAIENARLYSEAQRRTEELRILYAATRDFSAGLDEATILDAIVHHLVEAFQAACCIILRWDTPQEQIVLAFACTAATTMDDIETGRVYLLREVPVLQEVLMSAEPVFINTDQEVDSTFLGQLNCPKLLILPLATGLKTSVYGLVVVGRTRGDPDFTTAELQLGQSLATQAATALENARLYAEVETLAVTDSLTGIANRRAFDRALEREFVRARHYGYPLALIMIDIDSFKHYNDRYGHLAGDNRLRAVAQLLAQSVREVDFVARYGGEEFAIILTNTDKQTAIAVAEQIRRKAEMSCPEPLNGLPVPGYTLSLGVAAFPDDAQTPVALLLAADNAELAAKRAGKNRVWEVGYEMEEKG